MGWSGLIGDWTTFTLALLIMAQDPTLLQILPPLLVILALCFLWTSTELRMTSFFLFVRVFVILLVFRDFSEVASAAAAAIENDTKE